MGIQAELVMYGALTLVFVLFVYITIMFLAELGMISSDSFLLKIRFLNRKYKPEIETINTNKDNRMLFLKIMGIVLVSRLIFIILSALIYRYATSDFRPFGDMLNAAWNKSDSPHYLNIAENWYKNTGDEKNFIVFFPLYPIFIRIAHIIIPNYVVAAFILSNLCLGIACFYFYKLLIFDNDVGVSRFSIMLLLVSPFSFFLSGVYTESLFLALTIACLYYLRCYKWYEAAILGLLASLTRYVGILLVVPFIIELMIYYKIKMCKNGRGNTKYKNMINDFMLVLIIPLGTFIYLIINKMVTGSYFTFMKYQKEHWSQQFGFFAENLKVMFLNIFIYDTKLKTHVLVPQLICFFIALFLIAYSVNKIRISYTVYAAISLIIIYSPTWLLSGPRYLLTIFPIYLSAAMLATRMKAKYLLLIVSTLLLFIVTNEFMKGGIY